MKKRGPKKDWNNDLRYINEVWLCGQGIPLEVVRTGDKSYHLFLRQIGSDGPMRVRLAQPFPFQKPKDALDYLLKVGSDQGIDGLLLMFAG